MKSLRLVVLVLLAVLMPLRGVAGAVVACAQLPPPCAQTALAPHEHGMHGAMTHSPAEASQDHDGPHAHDDPDDHDGHDPARHCASSCAATPLIGAWPSVETASVGSTAFPRFAAPAARFQSGGPDRPPRRI